MTSSEVGTPVDRQAEIEFIREAVTIGPNDSEQLASVLRALFTRRPWPFVPAKPPPRPDPATQFGPAFLRAWRRAEWESRKFPQQALNRVLAHRRASSMPKS